MVSAIKCTCGIAALGLLTLASTCAWAGPVAGTCADVVATTPDAAASGPGMHASDVDDPPAVAFSIRGRMPLAGHGRASWRERVYQYGSTLVGAGRLKKKQHHEQ